jgi:hypothetical protein
MFHVEHALSIRFWPSVVGRWVIALGLVECGGSYYQSSTGVFKRNQLGVDQVKTWRVFYELTVSHAFIWRMT